MAVHGDRTAGDRTLPVCFYPHIIHFEADIRNRILCHDDIYAPKTGLCRNSYMVHWGTGNTRKPVYLLEEYKQRRMMAGHCPRNIECALAKARIAVFWFARRVRRGAVRHINKAISEINNTARE